VVVPNSFSKEYTDPDSLFQRARDYELNLDVDVAFTRTAGEEIGTYNIVAAQTLNSNYTVSVVNGVGKFNINPKRVRIVGLNTPITKEYDGNNFFDGVLREGVHYRVEGADGASVTGLEITAGYFNNSSVGSGKLLVSFTATALTKKSTLNRTSNNFIFTDGNFELPSYISSRVIDITPNSFTKIYGEQDNLTQNYYDVETGNFLNITFARESGENVGYYDITSASCDNPNFQINVLNGANKVSITQRTLVVTPKNVVLSKVYDASTNYNGSLSKGTHYEIGNVAFNDSVDILIYSTKFNSADVLSAQQVTVKFLAIGINYTIGIGSFTLSAMITPKTMNVVSPAFSKQYGDVTENLRSVFTDTSISARPQVSALFTRQAGESVGSYDITGVVSENPNYVLNMTLNQGEGKFVISPRVVTINVLPVELFKTYDGSQNYYGQINKDVHYEILNELSNEEVDLQIIDVFFNTGDTSASYATVVYTASLVGGNNYAIAAGSFNLSAHIEKATYEITADLFSKVYGETDPILSQVVTWDNVTVTFGREIGENAGLYDFTAINHANNNWNIIFAQDGGESKFEILRAEIVIVAQDKMVVYDGAEQALDMPTSVPAMPLTVYYNDLIELPINAGLYNVCIAFAGSQNYNAQNVYKTLIIERAETIITNTTKTEFVYDGTAKVISGTLNHDEAQLNFSRKSVINAGTYTITMSAMQTENYTAAFLIFVVTIAQAAAPTITWPSAASITYGQYLYEAILSNGISEYGVFNWLTPSLRPDVTNTQHAIRFTPFDTENIDWIGVDFEDTITVTVNKKMITEIDLPTATTISSGQTLGSSVLVNDCIYGTFAFANPNTVVQVTGAYDVIFTPYDTINYDYDFAFTQSVIVGVHYVVTYQTNGGVIIPSISLAAIQSAPQTQRPDFVFEGWYLEPNFVTSPIVFPYVVTSPVTLYACWRSAGLEFVLAGNGTYYAVRSTDAAVENITIPASYKGLPVKEILPNAFANNSYLRQLVVESSINLIGANAFYNCQSLLSIEFKATTPATVASNSLSNNVIIIVPVAAADKYLETRIWLNYESKIVTASNIVDGLVIRGNVLLRYLGTNATVQIPNGITKIASGAFNNNLYIKQVQISATVANIEGLAFFNCRNLETVTFAANSQLKTMGDYVFFNACNLRQINLPIGLERIGDRAFSSCRALAEITIPATITYVGEGAFEFWSSSQKILVSAPVVTWNANWKEACDAQTY
jgi:uncharacterized repeat protein (TIGR02543 family)